MIMIWQYHQLWFQTPEILEITEIDEVGFSETTCSEPVSNVKVHYLHILIIHEHVTTHPDWTYILQNSLTKKDVEKKQKTKKDKSAKVNGLQHDLYLLVTLFLSIDACGN